MKILWHYAGQVSKMFDSDPEIGELFKRFGESIQSAIPVLRDELGFSLL